MAAPRDIASARERRRQHLQAALETLRSEDGFRAWLTARRAFHNYSAMNVLWIVTQCPHATHVAGFRTWRDRLGYQVRKGEKGIAICVPRPYRVRERTDADLADECERGSDEQGVVRRGISFRVGHVFDRSQVDPIPGRARPLDNPSRPAPVEGESHARLTVGEAAERYTQSREALGRSHVTVQDYRSIVRNHFEPFFGDLAIDRVTSLDVEAYMAEKQADGRSPKSIVNDLSLLSSMFKHATRRGWRTAPGNPAQEVERPSVPRRSTKLKFLDDGEFEALLRACLGTAIGRQDRVMYLVAGMAGLRQAELLGLHWHAVDWKAMKIRAARDTFTRGRMKEAGKTTAAERGVPMAPRVAQELEWLSKRSSFSAEGQLVFPNPQTGEPQQRSEVHRRYKRALRRAGLRTDLKFHGLRHTFGTRLAAAGVPLVKIQEWMGHEDIQTTQIYVDFQPSGHDAVLIERAFGWSQRDASDPVQAADERDRDVGPG